MAIPLLLALVAVCGSEIVFYKYRNTELFPVFLMSWRNWDAVSVSDAASGMVEWESETEAIEDAMRIRNEIVKHDRGAPICAELFEKLHTCVLKSVAPCEYYAKVPRCGFNEFLRQVKFLAGDV